MKSTAPIKRASKNTVIITIPVEPMSSFFVDQETFFNSVLTSLKNLIGFFSIFIPQFWQAWRDSPTSLRTQASLRRLTSLTDGRSSTYGLFLALLGARSLRIPLFCQALAPLHYLSYFQSSEFLAGLEGFEPPTCGFGVRRSSQLELQAFD